MLVSPSFLRPRAKRYSPGLASRSRVCFSKTYTDESIRVLRELPVDVQYHGQRKQLVLLVVEGDGPSLLGRNWLEQLNLDWKSIKAVAHKTEVTLKALLDKHSALFNDELGTIKSFQAKLNVRPEAQPKFFRPRAVPFAIKPPIEQELDRLEEQGFIVKVAHSEWAAPIVSILTRG